MSEPNGHAVDGGACVDPEDFRRALSCWASGVSIFTAPGADGPVGITVSSFSSLSLDPPLVLGCIARSTTVHDELVGAESFAVHLLGEDDKDLSDQFAGPTEARFEGVEVTEGRGGVPLLPGGLAHIVCAREDALPGGDHTILVGRVLEVETTEGAPLVYYSRGYRAIELD